VLQKSLTLVVALALSGACTGSDPGEGSGPLKGSGGASGSSGSGGTAVGTGGSSGSSGGNTGGAATGGGGAEDDSGSGATGGAVDHPDDAAVDVPADDGGGEPEAGPMTDASTDFGPIPPGMTRIFDGKTLSGWEGNPAIWSVNVADGAIYGKTDNGGQLIKYKGGTYGTFRLIVTERMVATNNHLGICLWGGAASPYGYDKCIVLIGPQGSLWDYAGANGVYRGMGDNGIRFMWHQVEILADLAPGHILAAVNGKLTTDYTKAGRGYTGAIGLQAHAKALEVEYKDIWIDPAPKELKLLTLK
jgi:hypothetical protein